MSTREMWAELGQANQSQVVRTLERVHFLLGGDLDDAPGWLHSLLDAWQEVAAAVTYDRESKLEPTKVVARVRGLVRAAKRPTAGDVAETLSVALPRGEYRVWKDGVGMNVMWYAKADATHRGQGKTPLHALLELALDYERDDDVLDALDALDVEPGDDGVYAPDLKEAAE